MIIIELVIHKTNLPITNSVNTVKKCLKSLKLCH